MWKICFSFALPQSVIDDQKSHHLLNKIMRGNIKPIMASQMKDIWILIGVFIFVICKNNNYILLVWFYFWVLLQLSENDSGWIKNQSPDF